MDPEQNSARYQVGQELEKTNILIDKHNKENGGRSGALFLL